LTASTSSSTSSWTARRPQRSSATPCRAALRVPGGLPTAASPVDLSLKLDWIDARVATAVARDGTAIEKLCLVAEAAADRAEMHDIIGRQRDNWNHLLLHSTNSLTLAASVMATLAPGSSTVRALKASAGVLLATAAVNRIQPSLLAKEQRNATRLWRQLKRDVRAGIELRTTTPVTEADVQEAMERVLVLDTAYPLPLLLGMLEKFPKAVELARWWPRRRPQQLKRRSKSFGRRGAGKTNNNGWTQELEEETRGLLRMLWAKGEHQYLTMHAMYEDEAWTHTVMDLCTGPDLLDWVGLHRGALVPEPVAAAIVAQALALCH
ncbi:putative F-box protein, partial [Dichanthelium oligosanthes]